MLASNPILSIRNLSTYFQTSDSLVTAVSNVSLNVMPGETLGIVGESGSGKSQLMMSVMGLLASNGRCEGSVRYRDRELIGLPNSQLARIRGSNLAMIFQDPMTSLNPYLTIERQMSEVLIHHKAMNKAQALQKSIDMLDIVRIPDAKRRIKLYPHEFSGGMRQRVMIAMALLCQPDVLIADEPTTALDVTIQAQILDLLRELKEEFNTSILLITHDLGVIAGIADKLMVMYAGQIVETGGVTDLFYAPRHPYTLGLLSSMPRLNSDVTAQLSSIGGTPPNLNALPKGCSFSPRCPFVQERCLSERPMPRVIEGGRMLACHLDHIPQASASNAQGLA